MDLVLETTVSVVASAAHDGVGVTMYELLRGDGEVVDRLPVTALAGGRITFPARLEPVGTRLQIRAHIVLDSDAKTVQV